MNKQLSQGMFVRGGWANMAHALRVASADRRIVAPRLGETERSVGATTDTVGVLVVLAVVFPETHRADLVSAPLAQRQEPAARARMRAAGGVTEDVDKRGKHVTHRRTVGHAGVTA